ncbi:MAG TPA: lysozyme inhibitor LprI family protein [Phenylobacterium sp.]|nr:lysozyme inhibitor LprI family protein [Phenylobacterium sp.]
MAHDTSDETASPRKTPSARKLLFVGVVSAGLLGAGAGIWARPAMSERRMAAAAAVQAQPAAAQRRIQIVLEDAPAPIGTPIPVLPVDNRTASPAVHADPAPAPEPTAPVRDPQALVRVHAPILTPATPVPARTTIAKAPKAKSLRVATLPSKVRRPPAAKAKVTRSAKARADAPAARLVKVAARKATRQVANAPAEKTLRRKKPIGVGHTMDRPVSRPARAEPRPALQKASDRPGHGRKAKPAKPRTTRLHPAKPRRAEAAHPAKARAFVPPPRPVGLMRVSTRPRCASPDPGAALVCADPALGAVDRQLARAYRQAQAAGVSDERLQRQQQRWLAARSSAAREAPWAVRDVYVARIAELNGMAHEAQEPSN